VFTARYALSPYIKQDTFCFYGVDLVFICITHMQFGLSPVSLTTKDILRCNINTEVRVPTCL
jgi:hypothetical protein